MPALQQSVLDNNQWAAEHDTLAIFIVEKCIFLVVGYDTSYGLKMMLANVILVVGRQFNWEVMHIVIVFNRNSIMTDLTTFKKTVAC
jgi:hypothetical protein